MPIRILLLADTHLGFDLPLRPRVWRRRRGEDFLANFHRALEPARRGEVELVVHGGDVFHRPRVPPSLVYQGIEPLKEVADSGIPVVIVPGNHERGRIPHPRFASHTNIHIFHRPRSFSLEVGGARVRLSGFPYHKRIRERFPELLAELGLQPPGGHHHASGSDADISLLCIHHCVEGSRVQGHTFRGAPDVIRAQNIPDTVAAVLTGHIHRHQVLTQDLGGRRLNTPVFYPGSVERTAFAEWKESKGYLILEVERGEAGSGGRVAGWRFRELPARPMIQRELRAEGLASVALAGALDAILAETPSDAVLRVRLLGRPAPDAFSVLSAANLRARSPSSMNLSVTLADEPRSGSGRGGKGSRLRRPHTAPDLQTELSLL